VTGVEGRHGATQEPAGPPAAATAPTISPPKGGGAIRGIGEKFAANPVTGTGTFSVPIPTSPGRSGFGPQLSLSYESGAGNGPFGFGWTSCRAGAARAAHTGVDGRRRAPVGTVPAARRGAVRPNRALDADADRRGPLAL